MERVIQLLNDVASGLEVGENLLAQFIADLKPMQGKISRLTNQVVEMRELEDMEGVIASLKKLLAWSFVETEREAVQQAERDLQNHVSKLESCEKTLEEVKVRHERVLCCLSLNVTKLSTRFDLRT